MTEHPGRRLDLTGGDGAHHPISEYKLAQRQRRVPDGELLAAALGYAARGVPAPPALPGSTSPGKEEIE